MNNSNNNNWLYENPLLKNKNQRYYYDFGTGNKIERADVKEKRDALLGVLSKLTNQKKDDFLEGFNDPYGEKQEQERKERFAKIRENADKRVWSSRSATDSFLDGFNFGGIVKKREKENGVFQKKEPEFKPFPLAPIGKLEPQKLPGDPNKPLTLVQYANKETNEPWGSALGGDLNSNKDKELFLEGFSETSNEQMVKFPTTYLQSKPTMFPNTQLHAKPKNQDAFLESLNYPNGEWKRWEEEITSNPNDFQPNVLGIAPMGREGSMWCWIAAASMVDEYYHPENSASQEEISAQLGKGRRDGGYIEETYELGKGSRSCTTSGFSDRISPGELTYEKIQEEMQGKHPIVLLTDTGDDFEDEHYVVIVGCYTNGQGERYVIVNETREDTTKKEKPGLQTHIPYKQLKEVFSTGRGANQRIKAFYTTRPEKDSYHK